MKIRNLITLALLVAMLPVLAEDGPKIVFKKMSHNFGEIEKNNKVSTSFLFTNTGDQVLEIANVTTSCGCTSAKLEKTTYQPGESGEIPITFNPDKFEREITKRITVNSNDISTPKVVLTIAANILVDVMAEPESLFMSRARANMMNTEKIKVSTKRMDRLELSNLHIEPDFLSIAEERVDEKTVNLVITADGSKFPKGKTRLNGYLTYDTNSPAQGKMRGGITINVEQPINITPRAIYFYASKVGKQRDMSLKLVTNNEAPFKVSDLKCDIPFIKLVVEDDGAKEKMITIILTDQAPEGKFEGFITMATDVEGQKELTVGVRGSVTP